jgi:hypothetical protein
MKKIIIGIACIILIAFFMLSSNPSPSPSPTPKVEFYVQELFTLTNQIPKTTCKTTTIVDASGANDAIAQKLIASGTVDPQTISSYSNALATYKKAISAYNALPDCSGSCIGGSVAQNGDCVCPASAPIAYLHSDGKVYCMKDDLSKIPNSSFDASSSTFNCNSGFVRDSSTNNCYSTADTASLTSFISNLNSGVASINKSPTSILRSYGSLTLSNASGASVVYYITSQATLPAGLTPMAIPSTYTKPIGTPADCAAAAAALGATVFSWNPQTKACLLYTGSATISALDNGSLVIGSTTF